MQEIQGDAVSSWVGRSLGERAQLPLVFHAWKSHGQEAWAGYSPGVFAEEVGHA